MNPISNRLEVVAVGGVLAYWRDVHRSYGLASVVMFANLTLRNSGLARAVREFWLVQGETSKLTRQQAAWCEEQAAKAHPVLCCECAARVISVRASLAKFRRPA